MKRSQIFEAEDGTTFATAAECRRYEEIVSLSSVLGNLEPKDIHAGLIREHAELADALERAGSIIAAKRRQDGELKRASKASDQNAVGTSINR
jgi:hypothetical protein